jgi:hypothetical protein
MDKNLLYVRITVASFVDVPMLTCGNLEFAGFAFGSWLTKGNFLE